MYMYKTRTTAASILTLNERNRSIFLNDDSIKQSKYKDTTNTTVYCMYLIEYCSKTRKIINYTRCLASPSGVLNPHSIFLMVLVCIYLLKGLPFNILILCLTFVENAVVFVERVYDVLFLWDYFLLYLLHMLPLSPVFPAGSGIFEYPQ